MRERLERVRPYRGGVRSACKLARFSLVVLALAVWDRGFLLLALLALDAEFALGGMRFGELLGARI